MEQAQMSLDELAAAYADARRRKAELDAWYKSRKQPIDAELAELEADIIATMRAVGVKSADFDGVGRIAVVERERPDVRDWEAVYRFVADNDAFDLLQRRISTTALREYAESGVAVPGVASERYLSLMFTKPKV